MVTVVSILRHKIERTSLAGSRFSEILILLSSMLTYCVFYYCYLAAVVGILMTMLYAVTVEDITFPLREQLQLFFLFVKRSKCL